jgi:GNAT superfamily N-acetyltransferase
VKDLVIRRAQRQDIAAILEVYAQDEFSTWAKQTDVAPIAEAFDEISHDPQAGLYVATVAGDVVGTFQMNVLRFLTRAGGRVALIEAVMVARASRGLGIGSEMMRFAIAEARRLGCVRVQLTSQKRRTGAHRFYERLGFERSHEGMKLKL